MRVCPLSDRGFSGSQYCSGQIPCPSAKEGLGLFPLLLDNLACGVVVHREGACISLRKLFPLLTPFGKISVNTASSTGKKITEYWRVSPVEVVVLAVERGD